MNYTRPNDPDHVDTPGEWLRGALIFGKALGFFLPQGHGIVVDLVGDMVDPNDPYKKVVVYHDGKMISIDRSDSGLPDGTFVKMINEEDL